MTLKRELINYAKEHGWDQHVRTMDFPESLMLVRLPQPDEPRGKPHMAVRIEFDWDTATKVEYAEAIVGANVCFEFSGKQAIKTYLRENGWPT